MTLLLFAVACDSYDLPSPRSEDHATIDLTLFVELTGDDDQLDLSIRLASFEHSPDVLRLTGGDRLVVHFHHPELGEVRVQPTLDGDRHVLTLPGEATWATLALQRSLDDSARADVPLPPPAYPALPDTFSRADGFEATWTPSDDRRFSLQVDLEGACFPPIHRELVVDTGRYAFKPQDLASEDPGSCMARFSHRRAFLGQVEGTGLRHATFRVTREQEVGIWATSEG